MKPIAPPGQQNQNQMMRPRMGLQPYNPRTSQYNYTQPGGSIQQVNRGMPNMEGLTEPAKKVGMANFMDAIMPQVMQRGQNPNLQRPMPGQSGQQVNPMLAQMLARRFGGQQ